MSPNGDSFKLALSALLPKAIPHEAAPRSKSRNAKGRLAEQPLNVSSDPLLMVPVLTYVANVGLAAHGNGR